MIFRGAKENFLPAARVKGSIVSNVTVNISMDTICCDR